MGHFVPSVVWFIFNDRAICAIKGTKNSGVLDYWSIMGKVFYNNFGICDYLESRGCLESSTVS